MRTSYFASGRIQTWLNATAYDNSAPMVDSCCMYQPSINHGYGVIIHSRDQTFLDQSPDIHTAQIYQKGACSRCRQLVIPLPHTQGRRQL